MADVKKARQHTLSLHTDNDSSEPKNECSIENLKVEGIATIIEGNTKNLTSEKKEIHHFDPELKAILKRAKAAMDARNIEMGINPDEALEQIEAKAEIRKAVLKTKIAATLSHEPPYQEPLCSFLPVDMTRVSPFFPMSRKAMGTSRTYETHTWTHSWGALTIEGIRLSIYDEDVLLAILRIYLKQRRPNLQLTKMDLCRELGVVKSGGTYKAIDDSIGRLIGTKIKLEVWAGRGKERKLRSRIRTNLLTGDLLDETTGKIMVSINPYFEEAFLHDFTTSIDMEFRTLLRTDVAKALHRFLEGQGQNYQCHVITLAKVLNIDITQETRRLRALLKEALNELVRKNYLSTFSISKDVIRIIKASSLKKK